VFSYMPVPVDAHSIESSVLRELHFGRGGRAEASTACGRDANPRGPSFFKTMVVPLSWLGESLGPHDAGRGYVGAVG
jgi:hypothetical protein